MVQGAPLIPLPSSSSGQLPQSTLLLLHKWARHACQRKIDLSGQESLLVTRWLRRLSAIHFRGSAYIHLQALPALSSYYAGASRPTEPHFDPSGPSFVDGSEYEIGVLSAWENRFTHVELLSDPRPPPES